MASFSFSKPTATTTSLGFGFGFGSATGLGLNSSINQLQQQQLQGSDNLTNLATCVSVPVIFGDERDALIAKWNQIQAFWGRGKGYCSQSNTVTFTPENPFCRFKAVGYSCMPLSSNEDGLVSFIFNKKVDEISHYQTQIIDTLSKLLGNKTTLSVCVDAVKPLPDDKTELIFYIMERQTTGISRRFTASDVYNFLHTPNILSQLTQQLLVHQIVPKVGLSNEQLNNYLENAPSGIDPFLWQQAKLDNPEPDSLIPVPMVGFKELHQRIKHQAQQTHLHQTRLKVICDDLTELQVKHANMQAKSEQYKRKHRQLSHQILKAMVKQEVGRKMGYAIQADEEQLRVNLEAVHTELNAPTQFKGRLNEMMSQIRMQHQMLSNKCESGYEINDSLKTDIEQHLKHQQEGIQYLITIVRDDMEDLKIIEDELQK